MPSNMSQAFLHQLVLPSEEVAEGVRRQILGYNSTLMTVKVSFEKGAVGELHHHPHSQTSYLASGKFEVTIDDHTEILSAGDSFYVAPDLIHGVICLEAGVLIDSFSPMRADFL
jgi:quercetin dioxygenase-like cupin family protein